ncbi:MAG: S8 family serine peptidase [Actinobacteria bacterium]|nr:S8 family serine peptidase [Actinomycetota bacterium]
MRRAKLYVPLLRHRGWARLSAQPVHTGGRLRRATLTSLLSMTLLGTLLAACSTSPVSASGFSKATLPDAASAGYMPHRPSSCPVPTAAQTADSPTPGQTGSLTGTVPWPPLPAGATSPSTAVKFDHTPTQSPPVRPSNWYDSGGSWMLSSARTTDGRINRNPQELCGVKGNSVDTAWQVTTGSPYTLIGITDSGIEWCDPAIVGKIYINPAALPPPENAAGKTKAQLQAEGAKFAGSNPYDLNSSGIVNVFQYANDPRVAAITKDYGGYFCASHTYDHYGYTGISPMDLIRTFGTPTLPDGGPNPYYYGHTGPAGFTEAISGWNFIDNNNNPYDVVHYDHGTGEAEDSSGVANSLSHEVGACPNCMILPVRVGDSFIVSGNTFAEGVLFAVDSGASIVQEALGAIDVTSTAHQAVDYAQAHGVPVIASAADEESQHHNQPSTLAHMIVVNSVTKSGLGGAVTKFSPDSYLYLNGCTNYGANIAVAVESQSCSSEATGKAAGITGLIESAANAAMARHKLSPYPGLTTVTGNPVALSANEVKQIVTMTASSVNFQTAAPPYGPANNYKVTAPVPTSRYHTQPGFNIYTGYGRIDAAQAVRWVSKGWIPPQAEITGMPWFGLYKPAGTLTLHGLMGTTRACPGQSQSSAPCPWSYQVQVGIGAQPEPSSWYTVTGGSGKGIRKGVLARIPLDRVAKLFPSSLRHDGFKGGPVNGNGSSDPNKFTFTVRIVVEDHSNIPLVGMARRAAYLHSTSSLLYGKPVHFNSSIITSPTLAPIGPNAENVLLVATADGNIHALLPDGKELPGWPVATGLDRGVHLQEAAYSSGAVAPPHSELLDLGGGLGVGDLADASAPCLHEASPNGSCLDIVATTWAGGVYAWNAQGKLLPHFPVKTDPAFSAPGVANPSNRVQRGIFSAAALADLQGNGQLDIVASGMDRHLYAWQPDGSPAPGFPVLVVDAAKVASVNPVSNQITFLASSNVMQGTKLMDTPAVGNLDGGSGPPDLVLGSNEQYRGLPDANLGTLDGLLKLTGLLSDAGNSMVYAVYPNGSLHPASRTSPDPPGFPNPGAFLPGWPVAVADLTPGVLPDVGDGIVGSPALAAASNVLPGTSGSTAPSGSIAPTNGTAPDPPLDVGVIATTGPAYLLRSNGTSALGTTSGQPNVMGFATPGSAAAKGASIQAMLSLSLPALGSPSFADLGESTGSKGRSSGLDMFAPALSLGRGLDEALPANQSPHVSQLDGWNAGTGQMLHGFPATVNDMEFFDQPVVANLVPGHSGPYIVEGSSLYDVRAVNVKGEAAPGYPKFTGGWMVNSPTFGSFGDLGYKVLAAGTREGYLFVWKSSTSSCASNGPWPMSHHDLYNTNNLQTTGTPAPPSGKCKQG